MEVDLLNKREFCNVIDTDNGNGKLFSGRFKQKFIMSDHNCFYYIDTSV